MTLREYCKYYLKPNDFVSFNCIGEMGNIEYYCDCVKDILYRYWCPDYIMPDEDTKIRNIIFYQDGKAIPIKQYPYEYPDMNTFIEFIKEV